MSNLFYGGKDGRGFFIGKIYSSVNAMLKDLGNTSAFTDVNYGDYILISTENLNHPDNGMLFKRTTDFNSILEEAYFITEEDDASKSGWYVENSEGSTIYSVTESSARPKNGEKKGDSKNEEDETIEEYWDIAIKSYGAVYVGQIVGPSGNAPDVEILPSIDCFKYNYDPETQETSFLGIDRDLVDEENPIEVFVENKIGFTVSVLHSIHIVSDKIILRQI